MDGGRKLLSVSTASPYKFAPAVYFALTGKSPENELDAMELLKEYSGEPIPSPLSGVVKKKIRFDPEKAIQAEEMKEIVLRGAE